MKLLTLFVLFCYFCSACSFSILGKGLAKAAWDSAFKKIEEKNDVKKEKVKFDNEIHKNSSHGFVPPQIKCKFSFSLPTLSF